MNERIRELDKDAQEYAGRIAGNDEDSNYTEWFTVYKAKFAELIVQECAELIDNKEIITAAQTYDDVFVASYNAREECSNQIKQHFGVQE